MIDIYASAIIYMPLHERSKILKSIINIHKSLEKNFQSYEIILVNDSGNLISNSDQDLLKARDVKNITILNMAYFHDRENAMLAGTDLSNGDFIFEFDYTITNIKITTLVDLYNLSVENDADIVAFYNQDLERKTSQLFYWFLKRFGYTEDMTHTECIRMISRRALNEMLRERRNFRFRKLLYLKSGFCSLVENNNDIQYTNNRPNGLRMRLALDILMSVANIGSSVSKFLSLIFIAFTLLVSIYALVIYFSDLDVSSGWTTLMLFLGFGFSGIFMILFTMSRTLELLFWEVQKSVPYQIRDVNKLI
jgi:polyisoprenyl-phosphate glycosyltransferase